MIYNQRFIVSRLRTEHSWKNRRCQWHTFKIGAVIIKLREKLNLRRLNSSARMPQLVPRLVIPRVPQFVPPQPNARYDMESRKNTSICFRYESFRETESVSTRFQTQWVLGVKTLRSSRDSLRKTESWMLDQSVGMRAKTFLGSVVIGHRAPCLRKKKLSKP